MYTSQVVDTSDSTTDPGAGPSKGLFGPRVKLGLLAAMGVGLFAAWRLGILNVFADPRRLRDTVVALRPRGYVAFVAAYALLQPVGVPGTAFVLAAPLIWPWPVAFGLSYVGTMSASVLGFSVARFVARDWVAQRIPPRLRAYDDALARRGFVTVAMLRLVFWMPQILHAFLGVSRVPFWTHFWGSAVGYMLPLLAITYFARQLLEVF